MLFVTNALSPAKVQRVTIVDDTDKVMEVVVEDKQLSLAIGKKGQNVRLAAKLTGWRIDIKSEEEKRREVEEQFGALGGGGDEEAVLGDEAGLGEETVVGEETAQGEAAEGDTLDTAGEEPAAEMAAAGSETTDESEN